MSLAAHASADHECHVVWKFGEERRRCPYLGRDLLRHMVMFKGVMCDGCGKNPISDVRFKCKVCEDFDLCKACKDDNRHPEHELCQETDYENELNIAMSLDSGVTPTLEGSSVETQSEVFQDLELTMISYLEKIITGDL